MRVPSPLQQCRTLRDLACIAFHAEIGELVAAFNGDGDANFPCPRGCDSTRLDPKSGRAPTRTAYAVNHLGWVCSSCRGRGTVWELVLVVLSDLDALARLATLPARDNGRDAA